MVCRVGNGGRYGGCRNEVENKPRRSGKRMQLIIQIETTRSSSILHCSYYPNHCMFSDNSLSPCLPVQPSLSNALSFRPTVLTQPVDTNHPFFTILILLLAYNERLHKDTLKQCFERRTFINRSQNNACIQGSMSERSEVVIRREARCSVINPVVTDEIQLQKA